MSDLTTYITACVTPVYLEPRSVAQSDLPADTAVTCRPAAVDGWVEWVQDGESQGFLLLGHLDRVQERGV